MKDSVSAISSMYSYLLSVQTFRRLITLHHSRVAVCGTLRRKKAWLSTSWKYPIRQSTISWRRPIWRRSEESSAMAPMQLNNFIPDCFPNPVLFLFDILDQS